KYKDPDSDARENAQGAIRKHVEQCLGLVGVGSEIARHDAGKGSEAHRPKPPPLASVVDEVFHASHPLTFARCALRSASPFVRPLMSFAMPRTLSASASVLRPFAFQYSSARCRSIEGSAAISGWRSRSIPIFLP